MTILGQLTEYCDCQDVKERDVNELINLISSFTCWSQNPCETFLQAERKEVVDLPDCVNDCDIFEFDPFYAPFDKDSFEFTLIEQNGIQEDATPITDFIYSEVDGNFKMELPLPSCKCNKPKCGCESKFKLLVTYVAGYELLPECLLPMMCDALQWIEEKNKCDCGERCQCNEPCADSYRDLTQIDYASLSGRLQEYFLNILSRQYFRQLSLISLCQRYKGQLWAVVV